MAAEGFSSRLFKRLYKDASPWARDNILLAGAMVLIPPIAAYRRDPRHSIDWVMVKTALWLYLAVFVLYILVQLFKTIWKLDKDHLASEGSLKEQIITRDIEIEECQRSKISSTEWRELADKFKQFRFPIRAQYQSTKGIVTWDLFDPACSSLCMLAGSMLIKSPNLSRTIPRDILGEPNPVNRWLNYVKESKGADDVSYWIEDLLDGTKLVHHLGSIKDVGMTSENVCAECSAKEL